MYQTVQRKKEDSLIIGAIVVIVILVIIIIIIATSGSDETSSEEKFDPKDTNVFLVGKYEIDSIEDPTTIYSPYSSPPYYKEYKPLISSIYVDDEKIEPIDNQVKFKSTGTHKVEIYFKQDMEFLDGLCYYSFG